MEVKADAQKANGKNKIWLFISFYVGMGSMLTYESQKRKVIHMYQNLERKTRIARKDHQCDWCGHTIRKGEEYAYQKYILDGDFYEWFAHKACENVAGAIWDYVDPDEGMDSWEFDDGCADICREFVCPGCEKWNGDFRECEIDESYCIDKMNEFFKTHELYRERRKGCYEIWKCRNRGTEER